jgi:hypothetical protein
LKRKLGPIDNKVPAIGSYEPRYSLVDLKSKAFNYNNKRAKPRAWYKCYSGTEEGVGPGRYDSLDNLIMPKPTCGVNMGK